MGEGGEKGLWPHQGQGGPSPHGERREVGSSPREEQQQEGLVPPPTLLDAQRELEAQARMWWEHQQRQQAEQAQQQVWARPAPTPALTTDAVWVSLPTLVKTAVETNWAVILRCGPKLAAQAVVRHLSLIHI